MPASIFPCISGMPWRSPWSAIMEAEEAPKSRRLWGKVALGGLTATPPVGATVIDAVNNVTFGLQHSPMLGAVLGLGAIGLTAVPGSAAIRGWNPLRCAITGICLLGTALAAASAYIADQGAHQAAIRMADQTYQTTQDAITAAKQRRDTAQHEAEAISESASSATLRELKTEADGIVRTETTDKAFGAKCGDRCDKAKGASADLAKRIPNAEAKERALARVTAASAELQKLQEKIDAGKGGTAAGATLATVLAGRLGVSKDDAPGNIALLLAIVAIATTLGCAGLSHEAASLIAEGLRGVPAQQVEVVEEPIAEVVQLPQIEPGHKAAGPPKSSSPAKPAASKDKLIERFIAETIRTTGDGSMVAADLNRRLDLWWTRHGAGLPLPSERALSSALKKRGILSKKISGYRRYAGIELRH
jgi:hypothetical protein